MENLNCISTKAKPPPPAALLLIHRRSEVILPGSDLNQNAVAQCSNSTYALGPRNRDSTFRSLRGRRSGQINIGGGIRRYSDIQEELTVLYFPLNIDGAID